jgi:CRISPR/Cas system-associated exonuclease Cas4 (RecB family)
MAWSDVKQDSKTHLSATQISMYKRCPKQYEFRYIKGLKQPPDSKLIVGISVHKGVEKNYIHKFATKKEENKNVVMDAFSQEFDEQKKKLDSVEGDAKDTGYRMLETHYTKLAPAVQPIAQPEFGFEIQIPGLKRKFVGYIDVLASMLKIPAVVLDTKTTRRKMSQWDADISGQLTSYVYAVKQVLKKNAIAGLDVVVATKGGINEQRFITARDPAQLGSFEKDTLEVERAIDSGLFYPVNDAQTCSWCGYNSRCFARAVAARDIVRQV